MKKYRTGVPAMLEALRKAYPDAATQLHHANPFQLLVATILSAQCTDERVNKITPALFKRFPDPAAFANARPEDVEEAIRSTGFFHGKAKSIMESSKMILERFGGKVPRDMDSLLSLRGVARKTANVVMGAAFGVASGVVVDTHVKRLAVRLGLSKNTDPVKVELDLMRQLPKESWIDFSNQLVLHGRRVCKAIKPLCSACPLAAACPRNGVKKAG